MTLLEIGPMGERQKFAETEMNQHFGKTLATHLHVITSFGHKHNTPRQQLLISHLLGQ
jgi:hypothetical protein